MVRQSGRRARKRWSRTARAVFPAAEKAGDEPTADLLTQRLQTAREDRLDAAQHAGKLIDFGKSVRVNDAFTLRSPELDLLEERFRLKSVFEMRIAEGGTPC